MGSCDEMRAERRSTHSCDCNASAAGYRATAMATLSKAGLLWASLANESAPACWSCALGRPTECVHFFAQHRPPPKPPSPEEVEALAAHRRKLEEAYKPSLEAHLDKVCCRRHRATGVDECGGEHCTAVFEQRRNAHVAHTLRRLHETSPHPEHKLSLPQLMATDMLAPRAAHPHPPCRSGATHAHSPECVTESIVHHALRAHGVSREQVDAEYFTMSACGVVHVFPWPPPTVESICLLYTSPSPRDRTRSRMPSSA